MLGSLTRKKCDIQFMSDLHLERVKYEFDTQQAAPILILGGDIGRFCDYDAYAEFLRKQCDKFDRIWLVAGNHEFYGSSREEGWEAAQRLSTDPAMHGKLTIMNRTRVDLDDHDVVVLGCTLQSHIGPDCTRLTNDFSRIKDWSVREHNAEHDLDVQWLKQSLHEIARDDPHKRVVIISHYAPAFEKTCHPENERNAVSQCFSSDTLLAFQRWAGSKQVSHWIFGHTHWNTRFKFGATLVKRTIYRAFDETAILRV